MLLRVLKSKKNISVAELRNKQTFGGNYYNMLKGSFFFRDSAIGEVSSNIIRQWVEDKKQTGDIPSREILDMVGDPFIKRFLELEKED